MILNSENERQGNRDDAYTVSGAVKLSGSWMKNASDPVAIVVDPGTGLVKGLKVGEADIYTIIDGQKYSCHVTVNVKVGK